MKIFSFRETIAHFRTIIFSQSPRSFQFSSPILAGWIVFPLANAHHFFTCKNSCVQSTVLHRYVDFLQYFSTCKSNQMNIGCQTSLNEEGWMCARSCSIWMKFNSYKLLKRNTLIHLRVWSPIYFSNPILGSNSKSFQVFHSWTPLRGLRVICWRVCWIGVSPAFDF